MLIIQFVGLAILPTTIVYAHLGVFIAVLFLFCTIAQILQRSMATFQLFVVVLACGEGFLNTKKTALHYKTKSKKDGLYLEINKWEYMGITGLI